VAVCRRFSNNSNVRGGVYKSRSTSSSAGRLKSKRDSVLFPQIGRKQSVAVVAKTIVVVVVAAAAAVPASNQLHVHAFDQ
jgi:hypothetical protein